MPPKLAKITINKKLLYDFWNHLSQLARYMFLWFAVIYGSVLPYLKYWKTNGLRKTISLLCLKKRRIQIWMMWKLSLKTQKYVPDDYYYNKPAALLTSICLKICVFVIVTGAPCDGEEGRATSSYERIWVNFIVKRAKPFKFVWYGTGLRKLKICSLYCYEINIFL